jgi:hypothetical protein
LSYPADDDDHELNAVFGWTGSKMTLHYVALADRARLAAGGAAKNKKPEAVVEAIGGFSIDRVVAPRWSSVPEQDFEQILPPRLKVGETKAENSTISIMC